MYANSPMRCLRMVLLGLAMGGSSALAGTTNLLVTGQVQRFSAGSTASGLEANAFELWLAFDEPTLPDPERSSLATPTLTYLADTWSLAYFRDSAIVSEYNPGTHPDALGFAELSGRLTGFDSSETLLFVGVDETPLPVFEPLVGSLIDVTFITPTLVEPFFTNRLQDLPGDLESRGGVGFDAVNGLDLEVTDARLTAVSIQGQFQDGSGRSGQVSPNAIPTPTAAAAGALLMIGVATRRRRDAE